MTLTVRKLADVAIVMKPTADQIAVAKENIEAGTRLDSGVEILEIKEAVRRGHRFALRDIKKGEYVKQYGYSFARSLGISQGEAISPFKIENTVPPTDLKNYKRPPLTKYQERFLDKTFLGYVRKDGYVGTRNYYLVIPTSMCASDTAFHVALGLDNDPRISQTYESIDGIVGVQHTEGCGCDSGLSIDRLMRVLKNYVRHPNVGGCLLIDLGCEQTNYKKMYAYLQSTLGEKLKPIDWITIEESGGIMATRKKANEIIRGRLAEVNTVKRVPCPLEKLTVGTECGASDAFSGLTANPVIGNVVDKVIHAKGSAIFSEIPEMVGTLDMLLPRFRSLEVAKKFQDALNWYVDLARRLGVTLESNLVPANIEGGLINNYIKSLGAVLKSGTTVIEDVIDYGECLKTRGVNLMQGPGSDLESVTGIVASGANLMCFSTGYGTPTGNAICPVVKVVSNTPVFEKLRGDLDFNAGQLLTEDVTIDSLGEELLSLVIEVASGRQTAAEQLKQRQFQIWTAGKLSL